MGIKRALVESVIGHSIDEEYIVAARERYEEITGTRQAEEFPSDGEFGL